MDNMKTQKHDFNWKIDDIRKSILKAMLPEVVFDGWSDLAFEQAANKAKVDDAHRVLAFPNGAIDVAIFMHKEGDREMSERLAEHVKDIEGFSSKIEAAINLRLDIADRNKEAVMRAASLFALPQNSARSAQLIWHTSDAIWRALGDQTKGFSYYSKRTSLSAVYSSAFLYWLQDASQDGESRREFVHRRIQDVGNIGKITSQFKRKPA